MAIDFARVSLVVQLLDSTVDVSVLIKIELAHAELK